MLWILLKNSSGNVLVALFWQRDEAINSTRVRENQTKPRTVRIKVNPKDILAGK